MGVNGSLLSTVYLTPLGVRFYDEPVDHSDPHRDRDRLLQATPPFSLNKLVILAASMDFLHLRHIRRTLCISRHLFPFDMHRPVLYKAFSRPLFYEANFVSGFG
jgi:hypothetical protein